MLSLCYEHRLHAKGPKHTMGVRLDRLIKAAQTDTKISTTEVKQLLAEVNANGKVSAAEKAALAKVLANRTTAFEPAARAELETFLQGGTASAPARW